LGYLLVVEQECHASMLEALRPSMARLVSLSAPVVEMAIADVKCLLSRRMRSIEEALAYGRAAEARNAICRADLALELVVIRKLVVFGNVLEGIDDDSRRSVDLDDLGHAIGIARVIDETGNAALLSRVDDVVVYHAEQIAGTHALFLVADLTHVCDSLADLLSHVLDDEFVDGDVLIGVQAPSMDGGALELDVLLSLLESVEADRNIVIAIGIRQTLLLQVNIVDEAAVVGAVAS